MRTCTRSPSHSSSTMLSPSLDLQVALAGQYLLAPVEFSFVCDDGPAADWHVRSFELREALSEPYSLSIELVTADVGVDTTQLLGARCTLEIRRAGEGRVVHGLVTHVRMLGIFAERLRVRVEVAPAFGLLAQQTDTRFWQERTVPQILREVLQSPLRELGCALEMRLDEAACSPREYCVQYRESDLDFAARLMHEEGFVYYFTHGQGEAAEALVLVDSTTNSPILSHPMPDVPLVARDTGTAVCQSLASFDWRRRLQTNALTCRDWNWQDTASGPYERSSTVPDARNRQRARFLHDERRLHRDDGDARARRHLEARTALNDLGAGESDVVEMLPGHVVTLRRLPRPDLDGDYLLIRVTHRGDAPDEEQFTPASTQTTRYVNTFECIRAKTPYRAQTAPPRPRVFGPHTSIVVGPPREEIHTDEHGRIKVRFHWDRRSPPDDTASCWIRVAQSLAGTGWGGMFLPRVGMEVLVEFVDGDPDRPLVTGCVYNALQQPPYPLPEQRSKSTLRTESTPGGGGFNELRFEDARGSEELFIHAQRDLNEVVLHDNTRTIGHSQTFNVTADQTFSIGGNQSIAVTGNRSLTVAEGDEHRTIAAGRSTTTIHGDHTVTVEAGNSMLAVEAGSHTATVQKDIKLESVTSNVDVVGNADVSLVSRASALSLTARTRASLVAESETLFLSGHTDVNITSSTTRVAISAPDEVSVSSPQAIHINGAALSLNATEKIVLSVGTSSITIEPGGITVSSPKITSAAVGIHELCGAMIKLN
ncbi:type VI secretion system Vgr family protein [Nannocystis punicea]|uniref:Type VI secretion system tip protein TssI/VgrG n=1 Tax=Nannocystis punicea TaxID=2995304 RepID=A0ABY7H623_9BACT|nr:type VI secretion system tip protein TssI/VgrG [Nannocystis poenicansa]WAS94525.1 type VI secretion system tip protein TssI/VgrG [Nannocystis poenicansa]